MSNKDIHVDEIALELLTKLIGITDKTINAVQSADNIDDLPSDVLALIALQHTRMLSRIVGSLDSVLTLCVEKFNLQESDMMTTMFRENAGEIPSGSISEEFLKFFIDNNLLGRLSEADTKRLSSN
jgi:hypothetical protein